MRDDESSRRPPIARLRAPCDGPAMRLRSLAAALALVSCRLAPNAHATADAAATGARLYSQYCALCHGAGGQGYAADNAPSLVSSTFRATASDAFLRAAIERGRPGTAMGGYGASVGGPLGPVEVDAVMLFLREGSPAPTALPQTPLAGNAAAGKAVYDASCAGCHGTQWQRQSAVHLANPAFLASASDAFLAEAIRRGRPGTPMKAWSALYTDTTVNDVVAYVRSMATPVSPPGMPPGWQPGMPPPGPEPAPPLPGAIVLNPEGKSPEFTLKDDRFLPPEQLAAALEKKQRVVVIDARPPSDFNRLHIPGALPIPYYDLKNLEHVPDDGTWVVAYCACPHHASGVVVDELRKRGYKHTAVLDDGIFAWQHAGRPVVEAPGQLPTAAPPLLR